MSGKWNKFSDFMEDWKTMSPEKREKHREEVNTKSLFSRCEELEAGNDYVSGIYDSDKLDRGDFIIGRTVWDNEKEKYHDHSGFVIER